jgi:hypothetical protein
MQPRMQAQLGITDLEGGTKELQWCWRRAGWSINILACFLALFPFVLCLHQSTAFFLYVFVPLSLLVLASVSFFSLCSVLLSLSHSHGRKENPSVFYVFPLLSLSLLSFIFSQSTQTNYSYWYSDDSSGYFPMIKGWCNSFLPSHSWQHEANCFLPCEAQKKTWSLAPKIRRDDKGN